MLRIPLSSENSDVEGPLVTITFAIANSENTKILLSNQERLQLEEQIRKFVQLVTQSFLLSCGNSDFKIINESSKQILMELRDIALQNNMFSAHNLAGALDIIKDCENIEEIHSDIRSNYRKGIPHSVKKIIFKSKVFMYPGLLPKHGFIRKEQREKPTFTKSEDNLIAMGLENFSGSGTEVYDIQTHFLPCKGVPQIKNRIKNLRASKSPKDNPVKYYYDHRKAPPLPRDFQIFDPNEVRAPKDYAIEDLPDWFMPFVLKTKGYSIKTIASKINQQIVPKFVEPPFILPKPIIIIPNDNVIKVQKNNISAKKINAKKVFVYKPPFILPKSSISQFMSSNLENDTNINSECAISKDNNSTKLNLEDDTLINTKCIVREDNNKMADLEIDTNINSCVVKEARQSDLKSNTQLNTNCESKQDFTLKENDALDKVVSNKSSENLNSKSKLKRRLDEIIMKPLLMVDDKNCENGKRDSVSSINFINNKYYKDSDRKTSMNEYSIISPKKKKFSTTIDYFPNHGGKIYEKLDNFESLNHVLSSKNSVVTKSIEFIPAFSGKDCNIIIKSEVVEEISDSSQDAFSNDCKIEKISNSYLLEDCSDKQKPHFSENEIENKCIVNAMALSEMTPNTDKYNQNVDDSTLLYKNKIKIEETFCKLSKNVNDTLLSENSVDTKSNEFYADSKREYSGSIIKSEIIEEICDSLPDAYVKDCETAKVANSSSLNEHSKKQHSTFIINEIENKDTENVTNIFEIPKVVEPHYLHDIKQEMKDDFEIVQTSELVHDINPKEYMFIKNDMDTKCIEFSHNSDGEQSNTIIKSEVVEEMSDSLQTVNGNDCETAKVSNSSLLSEHCNKQNSNFVISETMKKDKENATNFSEVTKVVYPPYFHYVKQEIENDFEIAMTGEYVHDINTNKNNMLTKNGTKYNIDKQDINNIRHILNNNQVNKTLDYFPDPNDKEYGVIIKSEITEEKDNDSLEDVDKIDFDQVTLPVDSNSVTKDPLTKTKLISDTLSNMNKRSKFSHGNFYTITEFPKLDEQHDFYLMQNLESNSKINNTIFIEDAAEYKEGISIKSEIKHDIATLLPSSDDVIQKEIILKRTRNVTKSNSLEKAHLKISGRKTTHQSKGKQKCRTKKKISKRKKS